MTNKEFIKAYPLELSLPLKEARMVRKILKELNKNHVFYSKESFGIKLNRLHYYDFEIYCPTTNFAASFVAFGILYAKHVIPIIEERNK